MRTQSRAFAGTAVALIAAAIVLAMGTGSIAAPGGQDQATGPFPGDPIEVKDKDNRKGRVGPDRGPAGQGGRGRRAGPLERVRHAGDAGVDW